MIEPELDSESDCPEVPDMGLSYASAIERAGSFPLAVLREHREVTYRLFYDGTSATAETIDSAIVETDCRGWDCAEHLIDLAVYQLEEQGVIETTPLDDILPDGEANYAIALTARGRDAIAGTLNVTYWDCE